MNKCEQLHETIVRDVFDFIHDIKDYDYIETLNKKNSSGSIAKRASNLVLVFPVLCSSSLSIETAIIVSKAIERKCVSLLEILFSSVQITHADNVYDYVKQFHTNLDLKDSMDLDDFMHIMDTMVTEGALTVTDHEAYEAVKEDMKNINFTLKESYNPVSINDYKVSKNIYGESAVMLEAPVTRTYDTDKHVLVDKEKLRSSFEKVKDEAINKVRDIERNRTIQNRNDYINKVGQFNKDTIEYYKNQLLDQDVKKANELMPTIMMVNFCTTKPDSAYAIYTTGIIGVKAKLYPVDQMELVNRVSSKYKDKNGLFNFVRATTREISFFRDLAFTIDKAKLDAINMAKDSNNAKMFKVLERRAAKNRFTALMKRNDASPITSLVLSDSDVEYLKKYNNLDMEKSYVARTILEAYNLMDIVIADESLEIAKFLFDDGDGVYESMTFDSLEKEAADKSYKKVINLMSKMNR